MKAKILALFDDYKVLVREKIAEGVMEKPAAKPMPTKAGAAKTANEEDLTTISDYFEFVIPFVWQTACLVSPDKTILARQINFSTNKDINFTQRHLPENANKLLLLLIGDTKKNEKIVYPLSLANMLQKTGFKPVVQYSFYIHIQNMVGDNPNTPEDEDTRPTLGENEGTYLILYGHGKTNAYQFDLDASHHLGDLSKIATGMKSTLLSKGIKENQIVLLYTPTEETFLAAIHAKYPTGLIRELYVYSHGTANSLSLGGTEDITEKIINDWAAGISKVAEEEKKDKPLDYHDELHKPLTNKDLTTIKAILKANNWLLNDKAVNGILKMQWDIDTKQKKVTQKDRQDYVLLNLKYGLITFGYGEYADNKWIEANDTAEKDTLNENEILKINRGNFAKNAKIILRGCNVGNDTKAQENPDYKLSASFAQLFANHLSGDTEIQAFDNFSRYKTGADGKEIFDDGEMMNEKDSKKVPNEEHLNTFKPK